jgi:hypothetical protein
MDRIRWLLCIGLLSTFALLQGCASADATDVAVARADAQLRSLSRPDSGRSTSSSPPIVREPPPAPAPPPAAAPDRGLPGAATLVGAGSPLPAGEPHHHARGRAGVAPGAGLAPGTVKISQGAVSTQGAATDAAVTAPATTSPDFVRPGDATLWADPETEGQKASVFLDCTPNGLAALAVPSSAASAVLHAVRFSRFVIAELHADDKDFRIDDPIQKRAIDATGPVRIAWDVTPLVHTHGKAVVEESRKIWVTISPTIRDGDQDVPGTTFVKTEFVDVHVVPAAPQAWWKPALAWMFDNAEKIGAAAGVVAGGLGTAWAWLKRRRRQARLAAVLERERLAREADPEEAPLPTLAPADPLARAA